MDGIIDSLTFSAGGGIKHRTAYDIGEVADKGRLMLFREQD